VHWLTGVLYRNVFPGLCISSHILLSSERSIIAMDLPRPFVVNRSFGELVLGQPWFPRVEEKAVIIGIRRPGERCLTVSIKVPPERHPNCTCARTRTCSVFSRLPTVSCGAILDLPSSGSEYLKGPPNSTALFATAAHSSSHLRKALSTCNWSLARFSYPWHNSFSLHVDPAHL
jgi:hypothetical protein